MVFKNPKFDLNKNPADFYCNDELDKDNQFDDTALRLECFIQRGSKSAPGDGPDGCGLVLGLGPTPSVCCNDRDLGLKLGLSDHSTAAKSGSSSFSNGFGFHHVVDEGSTSAKRSGGYMPSLLLAPRISVPLQKVLISEPEPLVVSGFLAETASDQQTSSKKGEFSAGGVWCSQSTDCSKGAGGESGLWIKHGGGKRCVVDGWTRSAEGQAGLCVSHGGGRRCGYHGCKKGAQGSRIFFGVHGGGKLCALTGCTKGSTSFCKAQGGVKRCICGGEGKYEVFSRGRSDLCVGHGGRVQETEENKSSFLGITPRLFHGLSGHGPGPPDNHSLSCSSTVSNSTGWLGKPAKRRQLIPPQVLVPSSMKSSSSSLPFTRQSSSATDDTTGPKSFGLVVSEGRVHGGSLLPLVNRKLRK